MIIEIDGKKYECNVAHANDGSGMSVYDSSFTKRVRNRINNMKMEEWYGWQHADADSIDKK